MLLFFNIKIIVTETKEFKKQNLKIIIDFSYKQNTIFEFMNKNFDDKVKIILKSQNKLN